MLPDWLKLSYAAFLVVAGPCTYASIGPEISSVSPMSHWWIEHLVQMHLLQIDAILWRRYCGALFLRRCTMTSERPLPQQLLQQVTHEYEKEPDLRLTPCTSAAPLES